MGPACAEEVGMSFRRATGRERRPIRALPVSPHAFGSAGLRGGGERSPCELARAMAPLRNDSIGLPDPDASE